MKTPTFWNKKGILSTLLLPLGWLYSFATYMRIKTTTSQDIPIPVICIGNLSAGGTGKTPVSISFAEILHSKKLHPYFLSRGYGGKLKGVLVDNKVHTPADVGDEPLLLSHHAPIVVDADRYEAAKFSMDLGADILVMDDGFQNPKLHKDLSFIVVDGTIGFGNERPIPSGPLRESLSSGLKRANAVIIIGEDKTSIQEKVKGLPVFKGKIKPAVSTLKGNKIIAFAGIGRPEKFYNTLRELEADIIETIDFPDHHSYQAIELEKIIQKAENLNAQIYTTSKDYVKIPPQMQNKFKVLEIEISWEHKKELENFIFQNLKLKH